MWLGIKFGVIALLAFQSTLAERDFTFGLRHSIPGEPDVDYPIYSAIPRTSFTCVGRHEGEFFGPIQLLVTDISINIMRERWKLREKEICLALLCKCPTNIEMNLKFSN